MARRLSSRSLGVVFGGAGARAFAHLGVLEVLLGAGVRVDRVGGVSMGAFVGALLAVGYDSAAIDACCYEEWVRRNPINDYTIPRSSLIRGRKSEAIFERVFGETRIEELSRSLYCASVDLRESSLRIDHRGSLAEAVGASIALPLIAPPVRRGNRQSAFQQAKADHDFVAEEQELHHNTDLTEAIHELTGRIHAIVSAQAGSPPVEERS